MTTEDAPTDPAEEAGEPPPPACVMVFNANDPSGAGGIAGDVSTVAAMGAHALPIVTAVLMRDTAETFDSHALDDEVVIEQARRVLEDLSVGAFKVGFLCSPEIVAGVAEIVSDYPDVPVVTYLPHVTWIEDDDAASAYHDALRELILPLSEVLVGNQKTLTDFLLPEWDTERPPSARELANAAAEHGTKFVLVTGVQLPGNFIDNVLASPQGAITGEKFERFDTGFIGAGDTLSAALAAILSSEQELHLAVSEALSFLDQALDAGFRPGMGNVVPDRFFWALPPPEDEEEGPEGSDSEPEAKEPGPRSIH